MDILYDLQYLRFEWDAEKASANLAKHGVDFFNAAEVFLDPLAITGGSRRGGSATIHAEMTGKRGKMAALWSRSLSRGGGGLLGLMERQEGDRARQPG